MDDVTQRSVAVPRDPVEPNPQDRALAHWPRVAAFARQLSSNRDEADDLAQEAYLRFYRSRNRTTEASSQGGDDGALLFTITLNLARNRSRRRHEFELEADPIPDSSADDPLVRAIGSEERAILSAALRAFSPGWRAVLFLADGLDASYAQIAAVMGTSEDVVRTTLSRARRRLRDVLARRIHGEPTRGPR